VRRAQRSRVDGDAYACYTALAEAAHALGPAYRDTAERLQARAQDIGYRAAQPSADEIEADLRRMDNLVTRLKEEQTE
jgi:hypothetical protein